MDIYDRDSTGSQSSSTPEVRLILVGNMGCGKTLTADTLLNESSNTTALMPSRLSEVRSGVSEGRRLKVVETPRWYWKGEHLEGSVQRETEKALSLMAPGPHAFLILVPVGQFTEMEGRIPVELERVFGRGALQHTLVLLTCGDYLAGRNHEHYVRMGESGLGAMVTECGGRWHVINNRRPEDRKQVVSLLEKVEQLTKTSGGCYLPSPMQRQIEEGMREKERELTRSYSLRQEDLVHQDCRMLSQTAWSKEETLDESGRRKIRIRSMGPATGRVISQQLANGLRSQTWYDDAAAELRQKQSSFKLSKEGAILSQMSETDQPAINPNNQNFINTIYYHISTMDDTSSASPTASYSPSLKTFSSSSYSSAAFAPSSSNNFSSYSSSTLPSFPTKALSSSSSTYHSSFSSSSLPSSPTKALPASFSTAINGTSPINGTSSSSSTYHSSYSSSTLPSSPTKALSPSISTGNATSSLSSTSFSSFSPYTDTYFSPSYNDLSASSSTRIASTPTSSAFSSFSSSSAFSAVSSNTQASVFSPTTEVSSSFPSTNASTSSKISSSSYSSTYASSLSSPTTLSERSTTASSFFSSDSSDELRLVMLGRTGSGKSAAGNAILGCDEFKIRKDDATGATTQSCVKGTAMIGKKRVTVVDTPDWFWPPENMATHLSACMDLCTPGPHVFLLCVPVTLPGRSNLHDLCSLKNTFGPDDIQHRTLVLFTHSDKLKDGNVEAYIAAKRPELLELVEKCEDRFHVLKQGRNEGNIGELLEKVEQAVKESGGSHYRCKEQGEVGRERMTQLRRGRGGDDDIDRAKSATLHSLKEEEEVEQEEKNASTLKSTATSVASVLGTVLRFVGQKLGEGAQQVPKPLAGGAVLGGVLGLYFGGPIGGAVGATAGSAAAEYGRRKYNKPKTD